MGVTLVASGKQHFNATLGLGVVLTLVATFINPLYILTTIYASVTALFVHPDCDLESTSYSERMIQQWSNKIIPYWLSHFLMKSYQIIWYVYAIFTIHRGWTSHFPIVGTIGRAIYLYGIFWLINVHFEIVSKITYSHELLWFISVIAISDILHFLMDGGMFIFLGKKQYGLGKGFYNKMRSIYTTDV